MTVALNLFDRVVLLLCVAMVAAWGVLGVLDAPQRTEVGFTVDNNWVITTLSPDGPAAQVNMQVGDRIIRIDGIDTEDRGNILRLPRVEAGERRAYAIMRGDTTILYRPAFQPIDDRAASRAYLSAIVGFAFLLIPLTACLTRPGEATRILALMGFGVALAFFEGPHIVSYDMRAVALVVVELFMLLGLAAAVHFLLVFPLKRPLAKKSWGKKVIYLPMLLFWLLIAWQILLTPPASSLAAFVSQFFSGIGITAYLLIGLFLLLRNYSRTDRELRKRLALNRMLWGTVAAIIPGVVAKLVTLVSPDTPLPGQNYYFVFLVLIPITWSLSAARQRQKDETSIIGNPPRRSHAGARRVDIPDER